MLRTTPLIGSGPVLSSNAICRLLELHCAISDRQGKGGGGGGGGRFKVFYRSPSLGCGLECRPLYAQSPVSMCTCVNVFVELSNAALVCTV